MSVSDLQSRGGAIVEAAKKSPGRSSPFLCLFCTRNAHLCNPLNACYPGSSGDGLALS